MNGALTFLAACLLATTAASGETKTPMDSSTWTIHITTDNCPAYTWGFGRAGHADLLERDRRKLRIVNGVVTSHVNANGFTAMRLLP